MSGNTVLAQYPASPTRIRLSAAGGLIAIAVTMLLTLLSLPTRAGAVGAPVGLGTATSYAVLGGQSVTNTGPSVISGDLGVSPGTAVTGFPPGLVIAGTTHRADAVALQAQNDVTTAYNVAAGRSPVTAASADLAGQTLVSGVYGGPTLGLTGTLTLDGQGASDGVWVFQASSTLITASGSVVSFINGADPCNVYWQIGSSATLGTNSTFVGTILALTSISAKTRAKVTGRLLARNGSVTLDTNTITRPLCNVVPPSSPATTPVTSPVVTTPVVTTPVITTPVITTPVITTPVITTPVITTPVVTTPVITTPVVTTPVITTPVVTTPVVTTTAAEATATRRGTSATSTAASSAASTATSASSRAPAATASTTSLGRTTTAVGFTSNDVTLANTGVSPMLKPALVFGAVLCAIGAFTLLAGTRSQTIYTPRHY